MTSKLLVNSGRVKALLTTSGHNRHDSHGDRMMAGTQQGILNNDQSARIDKAETRLTLPEATMFIVASSGALWVLLFGMMKMLVT